MIKPTRYRASEPQGEAHFSPSRAVVSCDFQGAICKKEARFHTRFLHRTMTPNGIVSKGIFQNILQVVADENGKKTPLLDIIHRLFSSSQTHLSL